MNLLRLFILSCMLLFSGGHLIAQQSFELIIDKLNLFEKSNRITEVGNNRYVSTLTREIEAAQNYTKDYLSLVLISNQGEVLAIDSIMQNDTVISPHYFLPIGENGLLSCGLYGFFNSDFRFEPLGSQISFFDLSDNTFNLQYLKKFRAFNNDDLYYWSTPPVIKPGTDSCFIGWSSKYTGSHQLFCLNVQNGDSLFLKDITVPSNWSVEGLFYSHADTSMLLHYTMGNYTEYSNMIVRLNQQYELSGDTLFSVNTHLKPMDTKAKVHPNGNIYIGGEAKWVDWSTMQTYKHSGVFSYSSDFEPLQSIYLTHPDTSSQSAFLETMSLAQDGSIYIASNYNYKGHPFSGTPTMIYLARLDENLNIIWEKYIGGDRHYIVFAIASTSDMGVIVSGYGYDLNFPETGGFAWIVKYNQDGTVGFENEIRQQQELVVYPNPTSDHIHIKSLQAGSLMIYNSSGQLLIRRQLKQGLNQINLSALPGGTYFIHSLTNKQSQRQKIVKY